jgi:ribosomal protein S27AE
MIYLWCLLIGHDAGRKWYWDDARKEWYRDFRFCHRCGSHL